MEIITASFFVKYENIVYRVWFCGDKLSVARSGTVGFYKEIDNSTNLYKPCETDVYTLIREHVNGSI